jgi:EAL and modified HD-GYP domain-containing signal transduction protein
VADLRRPANLIARLTVWPPVPITRAGEGMADVFLARQPIFDRQLEVAGYELLFRGGAVDKALVGDDDGATATVVMNAFTEFGIERVVGARTAWLNVNRDFIVKKLAYTIPPALVGLEILEDQIVDGDLIDAVRDLKRHGYKLALDDYTYSRSRHSDELLRLVDAVKLDMRALGRDRFRAEVHMLKRHPVALVAEKVETREEYAFCAQLGCQRFQGYFFCKPELIQGRGVAPNRLSLLQLIASLQDPAIDLRKLEQLISRDVALSYRLLRYINSAFFGLRRQVSSIAHALALLGTENVKRWATLSVFAGIDDKPAELTTTALVRARFCERAASSEPSEHFTVGLFSVVDALMDAPMDEVLSTLPFPDDVRHAIVARRGDKGRLLDCVLALEAGEFERAESIRGDADDLYVESMEWANVASDGLFSDRALAAA